MPERPTPDRCLEAHHPQRTQFESIVERKLRRRQLTEDENVEISGRICFRELRYSLADFGGLVLGSSDG
jgi:hypothetical protein